MKESGGALFFCGGVIEDLCKVLNNLVKWLKLFVYNNILNYIKKNHKKYYCIKNY